MVIDSRQLSLHPVSAADLDDLVRLDSDPEVMRFVSGGPATPVATIADWIIPRAVAQQHEYGTGMWIVRRRDDQRFAGWVQLRTPRHSSACELELSYRLGRNHWGRGYATEASAALIAAMFTSTPAQRIFASTHIAHTSSRRVMEKLGMRLAAATRLPDEDGDGEPDDVEFELLREHWLARRGRHAAAPGRRTHTYRQDGLTISA
ncbi:MAG: GNAT family N-acetyltransferase [Gordonia sp. (in: high G+C Gram-positive bacteria)]